jgi:cell wall-associated NlpC family hydrolase
VFTREEPRLSELQLDMGVRIPLAPTAPDKPVNGQHPYASWILDLPVRGSDGRLGFAPALLPRNADSAADYLPLTRANLIRQAFKFLGERYGWGHSYNGRDCSGFVSEVYRSMGVELPRNTSDQAVSPAFDRIHFETDTPRATRMAAVDALDVGDLIYIPGHVMMFARPHRRHAWVIHDTNGGSFLGADGTLQRAMQLNGVSLTPLVPLRFGKRPRLHRPHHQHRPGGARQNEDHPMKITDIRFGMLRVPLKTPFKTALRTVEQVEDIVVMIHTDTGHVGYGSAPATAVITGDTHGSIIEAIRLTSRRG